MTAQQRQPFEKSKRRVLITGGAGFIGSHLCESLLAQETQVVVLDNFNDFYNPQVKRRNVALNLKNANYRLVEGDIRDTGSLREAFSGEPFDVVVHLAAMAGVRPSLKNPSLYMDVNVVGTQRVVDAMLQHSGKARLVFGSSSSVYGARSGECFKETDRVDQPLSPYAASKAANEAQLFAVHHTTGLQVVCLRFFTVYGPRQRPDLAIHKFGKAISEGREIEVFGDGNSKRDYTFVDDIISGVTAAMYHDLPSFEIINLGRSQPVVLKDMIAALETSLGKKAKIVHKEFQIGDVPYTYADIGKARQLLGYEPRTSIEDGIKKFVDWFVQEQKAVSPV